MADRLQDIEEWTTKELQNEIDRRKDSDLRGECWYCKNSLLSHQCKIYHKHKLEGWVLGSPQKIRDCEYRVVSWNSDQDKTTQGFGRNPEEAKNNCIVNIQRIYQ